MEQHNNFNKFIETENQKRKKKELAKFKIDPIREFATPKSREEWGHICGDCTYKFNCFKWSRAIIIKCDKYSLKVKIERPYRKKYR